MKLVLQREPTREDRTFGALYVEGHWQCWTLEDAIRELPNTPTELWKIAGKTAIPAGIYRVEMTLSGRFKRITPELLKVPGFTGIRIHPGNTAADTDGCLLPGTERYPDRVGLSKLAYDRICVALDAALPLEDVQIEIRNP